MTLDDLSFSCGASLQEAEIPSELKICFMLRTCTAMSPLQKLYYSPKFEDICIYYAANVPPWPDSEPYYPQCDDRREQPKIPTNKKS